MGSDASDLTTSLSVTRRQGHTKSSGHSGEGWKQESITAPCSNNAQGKVLVEIRSQHLHFNAALFAVKLVSRFE